MNDEDIRIDRGATNVVPGYGALAEICDSGSLIQEWYMLTFISIKQLVCLLYSSWLLPMQSYLLILY